MAMTSRGRLFAVCLLGLWGCRDSFAGTAPEQAATSAPPAATSVEAPKPAAAQAPAEAAKTPGELLVSTIGDCTLGDDVPSRLAPGSFHAVMREHGGDASYPFANVAKLLAEDDLTIANLETTLTDAPPPKKTGAFQFQGDPAFAEILVRGSVELANTANNHSHDMGERGYADTLEALQKAGVGGFGHAKEDRRVVRGVEVVNLGFTGGDLKVLPTVQKRVQAAKKPENLVFVSFHWGVEGSPAIVDGQEKLGHAAVDAGADLVIGTHPHVLQGIELYKGKHILYSLGNFVFGGNSHPADMDSIVYRERFTKQADGAWTPAPEGVVLPVRISSDKAQNDYRPVLLEGDEKARVLARVKKLSDDLPANKRAR